MGSVIRVRDPVEGVLATGTRVWVEACRLPSHVKDHPIVFHKQNGVIESAFVETVNWTAKCYSVLLEETSNLNVFPADYVHEGSTLRIPMKFGI